MLRAAGVAKTKAQARRRVELAVKERKRPRKDAANRRRARRRSGRGGRTRSTRAWTPPIDHLRREDGYVAELDPLELGYASMGLGAGRSRSEDAVDWGAGIRLHVQRGDQVRAGDALATLYASRECIC